MILPRCTIYGCNKLIDLMREDKRNQRKSVYSYLNATNYAKERCRRRGREKYGNKCMGKAEKERAEQVENSFYSCVPAQFLI